MQSLESNALEPTRSELKGLSKAEVIRRLLPVYGLPILTVFLIILFSVLLPDTFPTMLNVRSILSDKAIIAMLSLAAMLPMMAGRIDLTVGYGIVLWHILAISLQTQFGWSWEVAVIVVLLAGAVCGLINGLLVEIAQIDSFIATLGTGTILYALALWYTGGQQVIGPLSRGFLDINGTWVIGLPITAFYVLLLAVLLWVVTERLPLGRFIYAIGANPRSAALNGIPVRRYVIGVFVASSTLTAFAGVVLASKLRIGQASVGLEYLLPALVGAFLGSTTIKPGRVNVWGTLVGVLILAVGISGIQQFGGAFFVEPLFNGATLVVAIGIAGYAQRRRSVTRRR
ncbi:ABC transporter permease [Acidisoma cellulosilytica]|uniref:ABC transporter permease n=1 Tax=Acidisoma cellulosilyticum TaxID=2802395 RepID=A0A964E1Z1_9PROT|nr:ABC transporter permease [Acidisoma cellulosilyticum]MCB8878866.1 ABC transporter permease [Acidisoma cellulosilyticum]